MYGVLVVSCYQVIPEHQNLPLFEPTKWKRVGKPRQKGRKLWRTRVLDHMQSPMNLRPELRIDVLFCLSKLLGYCSISRVTWACIMLFPIHLFLFIYYVFEFAKLLQECKTTKLIHRWIYHQTSFQLLLYVLLVPLNFPLLNSSIPT